MKIQSVSDIITNSSSEVFIVERDIAEYIDRLYPDGSHCIYWLEMDDNFMENNPDEIEFMYEFLEEEFPGGDDWWHEDIDIQAAADLIKPQYLEKFSGKGYVLLSIKDHFDHWEDASDTARSYCIGYESRH